MAIRRCKITGIENVKKLFSEFGKEGINLTSEVVKSTSYEIVDTAKTFAPVDTGTLRNNIRAVENDELYYSVISFESI